MDDSHPAPSRSRRMWTKGKRDQLIDTTLNAIDTSLKVLDGAKDFLPVAGVGVVVPVLQLIIDQIRKTRTNSKTAVEVAGQVRDLVQLINETVDDVRSRISAMDRSMGIDSRFRLEPSQFNNANQFNAVIETLKNELITLPDEIGQTQKRSFFARLSHSSDIELKLEELKGKLSNAIENFRNKQAIVVGETVQHVETMVHNIQREIANNKYDDDLRSLPYVNASYKAAGDSGYVEGTRIGIIKDILDWIERVDLEVSHKLLLLFGAAGTGKSTIAREVCRHLDKRGILGASYFFLRSDAGVLGSTRSVFPTIAYQLASLQPHFREHVARAAREFMKLPSWSLKEQVELLIANPMKEARGDCSVQSTEPIVVITDALDEASGDLVSFLASLKELIDKEPRLRFIITARPEPSIMRALKSAKIDTLCQQRFMSEIPQDEVDSDIQLYLKVSFQKFWYRDELLAAHPDAIDVLTKKAEGLFIYARTVIRYLDCKACEVSIQRLTVIIHGSPGTSGMAALDVLYADVLKNAYDDGAMENKDLRRRVISVLAGLVILQDQVTVKLLAPLMEVTEMEVIRTLEELRSIILCSGQDLSKEIVRPLHLTLREFLMDETRCTDSDFFIDCHAHHLRVAKSCLRVLNKHLHRDMCQMCDKFKEDIQDLKSFVQEQVPLHLRYACTYWVTHIVENEPSLDSEVPSLLERFCKTRLLPWIETLSLINRLDSAAHVLLKIHPWAKDFVEIATILNDAYRFVARFFEAINTSPGQTYSSALSFSPKCSLVDLYADEERSNCMISPRDQLWGVCQNVMDGVSERTIRFSQDGSLLLSNGSARVLDYDVRRVKSHITIREATTCAHRASFFGENYIVSTTIHPNNRSIVSLLENGTVEEWDWTSGARSGRTFSLAGADNSGLSSEIGQVMYNPDGSKIVCYWGCVDAILFLSTKESLEPTQRIPVPAGMQVRALSMYPDAECIAALLTTGGALTYVKRWAIASGEVLDSLQIEMDNIQHVAFPQNNSIIVTGHKQKICVWDLGVDYSSASTTITGGWKDISALDVDRSCALIASEHFDWRIRIWSVRTGDQLAVYRGHTSHIYSLQFSPKEDRLVSTSIDSSIRIWDTRTEVLTLGSSEYTHRIDHVTFSSDGKLIATTADKSINVFDGKNGLLLATFVGHTNIASCLAFSGSCSILATWRIYDGVFLWDIENKTTQPWVLSQLNDHHFLSMALNSSGTLLAVVSSNSNASTYESSGYMIGIWDISDLNDENKGEAGIKIHQSTLVDVPESGLHCIRFSSGEVVTFVKHLREDERFINIWDQASGTIETSTFDEGNYLDLNPAYIMYGNWIMSTKTSERVLWLPENMRFLFTSAFAVKGDIIALGSERGKLSLLDMTRVSKLMPRA